MTKTKFKHPEHLYFLPLGGSGEIGMNMNLYAYQNKWLMVDCGITFTRDLGIEVLMPDPSFIAERRKDLVGLVLTHAHEDHIGAVPYLWERLRCPIFATPFTAFLVREKLKEVGLLKQAIVTEVPLDSEITLDPFKIRYITLTHSIPEPNALAISTDAGTVIHTGDWKIDPEPFVGAQTDIKTLSQYGDQGVLALVCDSTNAFVHGRTGSEAEVRSELAGLIAQQKNRVVVACFASNVARVESAALAGQSAGRKVVLAGRSLFRMDDAARSCGYMKGMPKFLDEDKVKGLRRDETLIICTGSQGEPRSALARIASGQHPRIKLDAGDTVIFSSRVIPGNEDAIKVLQNQLHDLGVHVITDHEEEVHVSGHPARDELKDMYAWVRPQILVPVHGEKDHMREQAKWGLSCGIKKSIVPENGTLICLDPQHPKIEAHVPAGRLALDGGHAVPFDAAHIKERGKMRQAGMVALTLPLGKGTKVRGGFLMSLVGVVDPSLEPVARQHLTGVIYDALDVIPKQHLEDDSVIGEAVRSAVRRGLKHLYGKAPLVVVHILR